jgi:hypothetical protein
MSSKKTNTNVPTGFESLSDIYKLSSLVVDGNIMRVPQNVKAAIIRLQEIARRYRQGLEEVNDAALDVKQEMIIAEPQVYVARTKDIKTEIEYFTAKTFWPLKNGKTKEVKIYLGKATDFNNDTMSIRAKETAKRKMSETLRRRKDAGEI